MLHSVPLDVADVSGVIKMRSEMHQCRVALGFIRPREAVGELEVILQ